MASRATDADAPGWVTGLRWAARVLGMLMVLMVLALLVGEGVAFEQLTLVEWIGMGAFAALCAGLLLGWKRELAGGILALAALAVFYVIELVMNGHPLRGWAWPLLGVPGLLYVVAAVARRAAVAGVTDRQTS